MIRNLIFGSESSSGTGLTPDQTETLKHLIYNPDTDRLEADRSLSGRLNSFLLGDQYSMTSGGRQIYFRNLVTGVNFYPAWGGIKDQSVVANQDASGVIPVSGRAYSDTLFGIELNGPPAASGVAPYSTAINSTLSSATFSIEFVTEEEIVPGDYIFIDVWNGPDKTGVKTYEQLFTGVTAAVGGRVVLFSTHPVDLISGDISLIEVCKAPAREDVPTPIQVRVGVIDPTVPYQLSAIRTFTDEPLANKKYVHKMLLGETLGNLFTGEVEFHADLPFASVSSGEIWRVMKRTANYWSLGMTSRFLAGYYESDGTDWILRPNAAMPTFDMAQGDTALTINYRNFTPADIASISGLPDTIVSPDSLKDLTITNTDLKYNDGTLLNRLDITSTLGRLYSPNGADFLKVDDTQMGFIRGGKNRVLVNSTKSTLESPDDKNFIDIRNTSLRVNQGGQRRIWMDNNSSDYRSPNQIKQIRIKDGEISLEQAGGGQRVWITDIATMLQSPDLLKSIQVTDSGFSVIDVDTEELTIIARLAILDASSIIRGPDGTKALTIDNLGLIHNDGTFNRFGVTADTTILISPDGNNGLQIGDTGLKYTGGAVSRVEADSVSTNLFSQDGKNYLKVSDTDTFVRGDFIVQSATTNRIIVNSVNTFIASPDGSNALRANNTGCFYNLDEIAIVRPELFTTTSFVVTQGTDVTIGVLTANIFCIVPAGITNFTVRDLNANIGAFTVRLIFMDGIDELRLTAPHDFVLVTKSNGEWYYYNYRNALGQKITT